MPKILKNTYIPCWKSERNFQAHYLHYLVIVWTPCLMHMCVCIWWYILQNYNYKLHFQNLSIYHIPHVFIGMLAAENLDVCIACDPWDNNIQLTMVKDRRQQIYPNVLVCFRALCGEYMLGLLLILISKSWGRPPGGGHAFPKHRHMRRGGGGGVIYFYQGFLPFMMPSMDGWWDGWMKKTSWKTTTTSFIICNGA